MVGVEGGSYMTQEVIWIKNKSNSESQLQSLKMNFQEGWEREIKKYCDFCHDHIEAGPLKMVLFGPAVLEQLSVWQQAEG